MDKINFKLNYLVNNDISGSIFINNENGVLKILTRNKCQFELYFDINGKLKIDLYDGGKKIIHKHKK